MKPNISIVDVTQDNLSNYPKVICFINENHPSYFHKIEWLEKQFKLGLKIKLLYVEGVKAPTGFIEYIPGEYCWRPVSAKGYMFIHCLWTNRKKFQHQGLGGLLIQEAEKDAEDLLGVAAITSDKSFMANREIFLKNGYTVISESGKEQLVVKPFKKGPLPTMNPWEKELKKYTGLTIVYSKQCPWVARFIDEAQPVFKKEKLTPEIIELTTAEQAQKAPSLYGVFNLIHNGKVLADRYISTTRLSNIIQKEIKPGKKT